MDHEPLGLVCQTCGDEGFTNAYIYCVRCLRFVIHRYCLNVMPRTIDEFVPWFCEDCKPATLPLKHDPSRLNKEDPAIKIALVKTPKRKKKQIKGKSKKRKIVPLLAEVKDKICVTEEEQAAGPDHECVSVPNQIKNNVDLGLEKEVAGPDHECVSGPNQIKSNVVLVLEKEAAGPDHERVSVPNQIKNNVALGLEEAAGPDHECDSVPNQIKNNVVSGLEEAAGLDLECVSVLTQIKNNVVMGLEKEAAGPDHERVSGPNQIKSNVVLGLEKGVFQQSSVSTQLENCPLRKHESLLSQKENLTNPGRVKITINKKKQKNGQLIIVSLVAVGEDKVNCPEEVTKPNGECAPPINCPLKEVPVKSNSGPEQIIPCIDKVVSQKQSSELKNQGSDFPESEPLESRKEDATNSAQLKTIKHKKKQKKKPKRKHIKKKKIVALVAGNDEEATKSNHECISPTTSPPKVNSDSGPNQITPCVLENDVLQIQHSSECAELDNNSCPVDEREKRTSDATSVDVRRKKPKNGIPIVEHSSCESSCTDAPLKHSAEEQDQITELKQSNIVDLVSDSSSVEKDLNDQPTEIEIETENRMHQEQGAYASQSAFMENNVHPIHYQPARPIIDLLWRGSFSIVETDYNLFEGFAGHLSSRACARVRDEANTLPSLLYLEMKPKTALWPKSFLASPPSDENIAVYFLPGSTRNGRDFERLVNDMIIEELAMKTTTKNAELLIFTSKVLPEPYWTFQGSYYLWGVFRRKKNDDHGHSASNTSDNRGLSSYQVPSEKEVLTSVMK